MDSLDPPVDSHTPDPLGRPSAQRAAIRTAVVWEAINAALADTPGSRVVDIGGGTGGIAVRLARAGHQVTVIDPSPDALAALARRASEQAVADRVTGQQGDLGDLADLVEEGSVDLVLCHGVLGILSDESRQDGLAAIARALRPGGTLSLTVGQRHAAVLTRAMAGHFQAARELLQHPDRQRGEHRFAPEEAAGLLERAGYEVVAIHGVRVFADLVPGSLLDLEQGATASLLELERAVADRPDYLPLAVQLHFLATCRG